MTGFALVLCILAVVLVVSFARNTGVPQQARPTDNPFGNGSQNKPATDPTGSGSTSVSPATPIELATSNNTNILVKDFLTSRETAKDPMNPGIYYLGNHIYQGVKEGTATNDPPYIIEYIEATDYFNIVLYKEPLGATRKLAEQYLIRQLGITESDACGLRYLLGVPNWVNPFYAKINNLGFSFCPGATPLP